MDNYYLPYFLDIKTKVEIFVGISKIFLLKIIILFKIKARALIMRLMMLMFVMVMFVAVMLSQVPFKFLLSLKVYTTLVTPKFLCHLLLTSYKLY